MTFNTKFPSLKDKRAVYDIYQDGMTYMVKDRNTKQLWVTAEDVYDNCLDQKKVREAIAKHEGCVNDAYLKQKEMLSPYIRHGCLTIIWKELGLK